MRWRPGGDSRPAGRGARGSGEAGPTPAEAGRGRPAGILWVPLVATAFAACAHAEPPPGARPDATPPRVTEIVPGRDTVVSGFDGQVRVRFDEPIQVGSGLERQLEASPADRFEVELGFSEVGIRPEDGWREDAVYCLWLPEGISDLMQNRTGSPIDFCFSTGAPLTDTELRGSVVDRVTGREVGDARVLFLGLPEDSVPYTAVTDASGTFRRRALPPRGYLGLAFQDRNRNRRLDPGLEPHDSLEFVLEGPEASVDLRFEITEPDSTPPVLGGAEVVDSLTLRLRFDDPLEPGQPVARVTVVPLEDGAPIPVDTFVVGETLPAREEGAAVAPDGADAPADTAEAGEVGPDTTVAGAPADTTPAPADTAVAAEPPRAADGPAPGTRDGEPRPARTVSVRLVRPLGRGTFRVQARDFRNVRGLTGGGDTTFVHPPGQP